MMHLRPHRASDYRLFRQLLKTSISIDFNFSSQQLLLQPCQVRPEGAHAKEVPVHAALTAVTDTTGGSTIDEIDGLRSSGFTRRGIVLERTGVKRSDSGSTKILLGTS